MAESKTFAFVLYPGLTILDLVGPLQVISGLQRFDESYEVTVVAESLDVFDTDTPLRVGAQKTFDDVLTRMGSSCRAGVRRLFARWEIRR